MQVTGLSLESGESEGVIISHVKQHAVEWAQVPTESIIIKRMSGLSNACYRVAAPGVPTVLYRKFENKIIDLKLEQTVFSCLSEGNIGPKLVF